MPSLSTKTRASILASFRGIEYVKKPTFVRIGRDVDSVKEKSGPPVGYSMIFLSNTGADALLMIISEKKLLFFRYSCQPDRFDPGLSGCNFKIQGRNGV
jgi:hypothetical protein